MSDGGDEVLVEQAENGNYKEEHCVFYHRRATEYWTEGSLK